MLNNEFMISDFIKIMKNLFFLMIFIDYYTYLITSSKSETPHNTYGHTT